MDIGLQGLAARVATTVQVRIFALELAYSNVWISLTAIGFVLTNQMCMAMPVDGRPCFLAFATIFMVYTFAKAIHFDPQADQVNDPDRTRFLLRWRRPLVAAAVACYGLALVLAHRWGVTWLCILPFLTALVYDVKWLPGHWKYRRLKDIPGVKSMVVALTWAMVTVLFPVLVSGFDVSSGCWVLLLWNTLLWFVNTAFFDLGDMRGDALEGTRTLPLILGFQTTRRLLLALTLVAAALLEWARWQGMVSPQSAWANLISLYSAAYLWGARDEDSDLGFRCDVVADGMGIFGALLVALVAFTQ